MFGIVAKTEMNASPKKGRSDVPGAAGGLVCEMSFSAESRAFSMRAVTFDQAAFARDSSFFTSSPVNKFAAPSMTVSLAASSDVLRSQSKIAAKRIIPTIGKATEITAMFNLW